MYDPSNNQYYYEDPNNLSPETIKILVSVTDDLRKGHISEEVFLNRSREVREAASNNCVTVSKYINKTQMSIAIDSINQILSHLCYAAERISVIPIQCCGDEGNPQPYDKALEDENIEEICNMIDGIRDNLFGVRQAVVALCAA